MTPANLAHHRTNPNMAFWTMIKIGNDHFETTRLEPKVEVCNRRYVFDAQPPRHSSNTLVFDPTSKCPALCCESDNRSGGKQHADEVEYKKFVKANVPVAAIRSGRDGGMNRVFLDQLGGRMPPANLPPPGSRPVPPPPGATAEPPRNATSNSEPPQTSAGQSRPAPQRAVGSAPP
jgi:hypothetical protein